MKHVRHGRRKKDKNSIQYQPDNRTFHIFLTEQGLVQAGRVREAFARIEAETFEEFSGEQVEGFMKMLADIHGHLTQ